MMKPQAPTTKAANQEHEEFQPNHRADRVMLAYTVVASFWQTQLQCSLPWALDLPLQALACALLLLCSPASLFATHTALSLWFQGLISYLLTTCCNIVTDIHLGSQADVPSSSRTVPKVPAALLILLVLLLPVYVR